MAALTMHVRCPVKGCGQLLDVEQHESWGEVSPTDHGCITITLTDPQGVVRAHLQTHTHHEIDAAAAAHRPAAVKD